MNQWAPITPPPVQEIHINKNLGKKLVSFCGQSCHKKLFVVNSSSPCVGCKKKIGLTVNQTQIRKKSSATASVKEPVLRHGLPPTANSSPHKKVHASIR